MTTDIKLEDLASAIADLSISGVTVRDIDNIPANAKTILPVLYPVPNGFVTDLAWSRESFGDDNVRAMNLTYILHSAQRTGKFNASDVGWSRTQNYKEKVFY